MFVIGDMADRKARFENDDLVLQEPTESTQWELVRALRENPGQVPERLEMTR